MAELSFQNITQQDVEGVLKQALSVQTPSLLITADDERQLRANMSSDPLSKALAEAIVQDADRRLDLKPMEYIVTGRRLLSVSNDCLARVASLAMAFRLTGERKYVDKAEEEMLTAAAFPDWNPSHFLDVAVMTTSLGIGYDWLFSDLSLAGRKLISNAIIQKGLLPSLEHDQWTRFNSNWNQICNGGMVMGALAVRRLEPELAANIIHRAVSTIHLPMEEYEPHGTYPEGPGYWDAGTTYNVLLIAALESVFGTDFGLSGHSGFANSADYFLHMSSPTDRYFNYYDCGSGGGVSPIVFWFSRRYDKPYLTYRQVPRLWDEGQQKIRTRASWMFPMLLLWQQTTISVPTSLSWMGLGETPVAAFRSSWVDSDAAYLAIKGGRARTSHAHIDGGSFVYEVDGVRWAMDLGPQNYNQLESRGMDLWNRKQNSDRWKIFRYNNFSHNTLTVNDALHDVNGVVRLLRYCGQRPNQNVIFDMSELFNGQLEKAVRGAALRENRQAMIQDELTAGQEAATVRWAMVSPGTAEILSPTTARLKEQGKTLTVEVRCPKKTQLKIYSTEPREEWDAPNPNTYMIGFEVRLKPREQIRMAVILTPGSAEQTLCSGGLMPLQEWPSEVNFEKCQAVN